MLEHETDVILEALLARTIGAREAILFGEIQSADIPRGIKTYLQADIVRALESELYASPRLARVQRDAPGVRRQGRAFVASMVATYAIPRAEFLPLMENAVHFLENYLCRPQWTIERFVFESADRVSLGEMTARLDCTVEYAYFRTLIPRVMERRGMREINAGEFRTILGTIDDQIVRQHNARELALLAKPIFDFLLLRDTPPDVSIPLKPILVFFDDKKMKILRDYIESISRIRKKEEITLDELTTLVEDLYLGQGEPEAPAPGAGEGLPAALFAPEPAQPDSATGEPVRSDLAAAEPAQHDSATPGPERHDSVPAGPAQKDLTAAGPDRQESTAAEELTRSGTPHEPPPSAGPGADLNSPHTEPPEAHRSGILPPESPPAAEPGDEETDRRVFEPTLEIRMPSTFDFMTEEPDGREEVSPSDEPPALRDIRQMIDVHERSRFVRKLFDRDEEKYEDTITSLNGAADWKAAAKILNSLYLASGLDPFDADVVEFTDAIQRRYQDTARDNR